MNDGKWFVMNWKGSRWLLRSMYIKTSMLCHDPCISKHPCYATVLLIYSLQGFILDVHASQPTAALFRSNLQYLFPRGDGSARERERDVETSLSSLLMLFTSLGLEVRSSFWCSKPINGAPNDSSIPGT